MRRSFDEITQEGHEAMERGDYAEAYEQYEKSLEIDPRHLANQMNAGMCLMAQGVFEEAMPHFERAIEIRDDIPQPHHHLGLALAYQQRHEEAVVHFERAIIQDAGFAEAYLDTAQSYQALGKHKHAIATLKRLLEVEQDNVHALNMLGISYTESGELNASIRSYLKAMKKVGEQSSILANLVKSLLLAHDWRRLKKYLPMLEKLAVQEYEAGRPVSKTPFTSLLTSQKLHTVREHTEGFLRRSPLDIHIAPHWQRDLAGKKPLKIGYLSSDFRNAVNGHLCHAMFAHHDRKYFHVTAIANHFGDGSVYEQAVKDGVDRYVQLTPSDDMLTTLRALDLDILIDMNGLHDLPMLPILAKRVAHVQMLYLGWAGTSATRIYDYLITDHILTPAEHRHGYTEALLQLDRCYQVASYAPLPTQLPDRSTYDLPEKAVVYASFFASYKMHEALFDSWMNILVAVPDSVLWVKHTYRDATKRLKRAMEKARVDPGRMIGATFVPLPEHMSRLRLVDVALDTWPYTGGASTSNMLYAGVPVVAMQGSHYASRMSMSMLSYLGMSELITKDQKRYTDLAIKLGNDVAFRENMQKRMASKVAATKMFDPEDFVRHLETKLLELTGNSS